MDLPLFSALFAALALTLYVMLDGFDLGVGALLLFQPDEALRDRMVDSIMPTWDGNETWLIMAGVALLAAFPVAYGILLPGLYLPLIAMLLALGLRGVSFEFRYQTEGARRIWDIAFGVGSITAALMQGMVVGALIQGVNVEGERFSGHVLDAFSPFALLTAVALLVGYCVLGSGWLHLKATGALRGFADLVLSRLIWLFAALAVATCVNASFIQPGIAAAWVAYPWFLAVISVLFFGVAVSLTRAINSGADGLPFLLGLTQFALAICGLGVAIFPDIVPFRLSLWETASATRSQIFLLAGAAVVTPVVLAYSAFAYRVFHGKTPDQGWDL